MSDSTSKTVPRCLLLPRKTSPKYLVVPGKRFQDVWKYKDVQKYQEVWQFQDVWHYHDVWQYNENNTKMSSSNKENRCLVDTRKYQEIWQYQGKHYQDVLQENVTKISGSQHKNVTMLSLSTSISIILIDNMALVYFLTVAILQQKPITWIYQLIKSRRSF